MRMCMRMCLCLRMCMRMCVRMFMCVCVCTCVPQTIYQRFLLEYETRQVAVTVGGADNLVFEKPAQASRPAKVPTVRCSLWVLGAPQRVLFTPLTTLRVWSSSGRPSARSTSSG